VKWVVVFAGSRDRYQVPLALAENDRLERLVTDFYAPLDAPLGPMLRRVAPSAHAVLGNRYKPGLSSAKVSWSVVGLSSDYCIHKTQVARDDRLAIMAGGIARARGCGLLSYSYYGYRAFNSVGLEHWPKVLMQVHPHPMVVRKILQDELEYTEFGKSSLLSEQELSSDQGRFEQLAAEALVADHCIVASNFTKRTLIENAVPEHNIHVVPYGVDVGTREAQRRRSNQFRVVFVGQMVQRKGLEYLLKAWKRLRLPKAELVLAGRGRVDANLLAAFRSDVTYMNNLSDREREELYDSCDLFCMPSLVEGFGLVYLEALERGLPVIATPNTGAADIVQDGREGFIVPIRDIDALAEKLEWAYANRSALAEMGTAARRLAEQYSWARFRAGIRESLTRIEDQGKYSHYMATSRISDVYSG
jgi:glycosyltransferase involved in cell wall biosynthesis